MAKHFDLGGGLRMRWELTATNILNTPNWSNPATNISSLALGAAEAAHHQIPDLAENIGALSAYLAGQAPPRR